MKAIALPICQRTLALYRPGVPMAGVTCRYSYSGSMPNTGRLRCTLCGTDAPLAVAEQTALADEMLEEIIKEERAER